LETLAFVEVKLAFVARVFELLAFVTRVFELLAFVARVFIVLSQPILIQINLNHLINLILILRKVNQHLDQAQKNQRHVRWHFL
jgi:hypothetical protein